MDGMSASDILPDVCVTSDIFNLDEVNISMISNESVLKYTRHLCIELQNMWSQIVRCADLYKHAGSAQGMYHVY